MRIVISKEKPDTGAKTPAINTTCPNPLIQDVLIETRLKSATNHLSV